MMDLSGCYIQYHWDSSIKNYFRGNGKVERQMSKMWDFKNEKEMCVRYPNAQEGEKTKI